MATSTKLANQVKVGHALDASSSIKSRGPERAHQNNKVSWRSSRTNADFRDRFEWIKPFNLCFVPHL